MQTIEPEDFSKKFTEASIMLVALKKFKANILFHSSKFSSPGRTDLLLPTLQINISRPSKISVTLLIIDKAFFGKLISPET